METLLLLAKVSLHWLLDCTRCDPVTALANPFLKSSSLKDRIAMLYKNKNSNWSLGKYAAVALLIGFVSLMVASCERDSLPLARDTANKNVSGMISVFGVVNDAEGNPLPGAGIEVKGTTRGTSTDREGKFRLEMPAGSDLVVKLDGFKEHLLKVNPKYERVAFEVKMTPGDGQESTQGMGIPAADGKSLRVINQTSTYNGEPVFTVVEQQPEFPGGIEALRKFLGENIRYPAPARRANVQGKVFLSFFVTKEGEIKDINILKGMGFGLDEEALRVMSLMPRWTPGKQSGKPLNVRYNLPIAFELDKKPGLQTGEESKKVGIQGISLDSEIERAAGGPVTGGPMNLLEGSDEPLLVVNGKIVSDRSEKPELDPAAVESINIMKDAAAIKKYGDKGKNGAVEIILKKGKS